MSCCDDVSHCANVREKDGEVSQRLHEDPQQHAGLQHRALRTRLIKNNVELVHTIDLLTGDTGEPGCRMDVLMDTLISCWRRDPVHGDRKSYSKIATGLLNRISRPHCQQRRPRTRGKALAPGKGCAKKKTLILPLLESLDSADNIPPRYGGRHYGQNRSDDGCDCRFNEPATHEAPAGAP
jgi:hypothetical protein